MFSSIKSYFFSKLATRNSRHADSRRRLKRGTDLRVEPLEQRRLLSVNEITFDPETSQVLIGGTSGADEVLVSAPSPDLIHIRMRNSEGTIEGEFQRSAVASVSFVGDAGNDYYLNETSLASIVSAGEGDDTIHGGSEGDAIFGDEGNDSIFGGAGFDVIAGGIGDDTLRGDAGDDQLFGEHGADNLSGGDGSDLIYGGENDDFITGGTDNDYLRGDGGDDQIFGEDGFDNLIGGEGTDSVYGGEGADVIAGGIGDDKLRGDNGDDEIFGEHGNDNLQGGEGADLIYGGEGADFVMGGIGDDKLRGDGGDDEIFGEHDNDNLQGGDGADLIYGGIGSDFITGGIGDDRLRGDEGDDEIFGEHDNDNLHGGDGADLIYGGIGSDFITGGIGDDRLRGDEGDDEIFGEHDNDNLHGGDGNDFVYGGLGAEFIRGGGGNDTLRGDQGDDRIFGDEGNDNLSGADGADLIYGGIGSDFITGGFGDDQLRGDDADDQIYGDEGDDNLNGGEGNDTVYGGLGADYIRGDGGNDTLRADEGDDRLFGDDGDDSLFGLDGNDSAYGGNGADFIFGGAGDDDISGEVGDDQLYGFDGDDRAWGGPGNDQLYGESGHDGLVGNSGEDLLIGSAGNDVLFGGEDRDSLDGMADDDLLIGGEVAFENSSERIRLLQLVWSSIDSYDSRITDIQSDALLRLESDESVFDDQIRDAVFGSNGTDWFFLTGSVPIYTPVMGNHHHDSEGSHHSQEIVHTLPPLEGFDFIDSLDNLADVQADETIQSKIAHSESAVLQNEHLSLVELVRYDQITHFAIADGNWSDSATWLHGRVPTSGAKVLISYGTHVMVDRVVSTRLSTVRVDGTLSFATQSNTELRVDTLVVTSSGAFEMGTEQEPIASHATARLLILDNGPIDRSWDPFGISRGLISHGRVVIHGTPVQTQSTLEGEIVAGTNLLPLREIPLNWKVGDEIVIAATRSGVQQNEVRQILGVFGSYVQIAPLTYDHLAPSPDLAVHVAHLTRNAVIESESTSVDRRGHTMFMHSRDVSIQYAGFYSLGRTDKSVVLNDSVVDGNWQLQAGSGTNQRSRYSVHFHRNGTADEGTPVFVNGNAVVDSPGWGFVNHSSYVEMVNNVAFNVRGAAFATEVGDEIGSFRRNMAIGTTGTGEHINARLHESDFGFQGDGFWFQGAGISVTDNVSAGNMGGAYVFYTRGLIEGGVRKSFQSENLLDPTIAGGNSTIDVDFVPVREFRGNLGYSSTTGLTIRYNLRNAPHQTFSYLTDSTFWNNTTGVDLTYSQQLVLQNLSVIQDEFSLQQYGIRSNNVTQDIVFENLTVSGFEWGIEVPRSGFTFVSGGYYNNRDNFVIGTPSSDSRSVLITGPIEFGVLPQSVLPILGQVQVIMRSDLLPGLHSAFYQNSVVLNYGPFDNQRAYYASQFLTAVPFPTAGEGIPLPFVGLTSKQLRDQFGLTVGGELAPNSAVPVPGVDGLVAPVGV